MQCQTKDGHFPGDFRASSSSALGSRLKDEKVIFATEDHKPESEQALVGLGETYDELHVPLKQWHPWD